MNFVTLFPELLVKDVSAAARFYNETFGMEVEVLYEVEGHPQNARLSLGDHITVFLNRQPKHRHLESELPPAKLWFVVNGIEEIHTRLRQAGRDIMDIDETGYSTKEFMLTDPDGYRIGVQERQGW